MDQQNVEVAFLTAHDIAKVTVQKESTYFDINGNPSPRQQFPLQNVFALTQGLRLPYAIVSVNEEICSRRVKYMRP